MSLARETGREEKASMFHDMRESFCVRKVSMFRFRDARDNPCVTWLCAFLQGMGAHLRVEWLNAERVRQSLLVTIFNGGCDLCEHQVGVIYANSRVQYMRTGIGAAIEKGQPLLTTR